MRYTNFGSFLSRNEFGNLMREIELENNAPNTLVSSSLSLHVEVATEPPGPRPPPTPTAPVPVRGEAGLLRAGEGAEVLT